MSGVIRRYPTRRSGRYGGPFANPAIIQEMVAPRFARPGPLVLLALLWTSGCTGIVESASTGPGGGDGQTGGLPGSGPGPTNGPGAASFACNPRAPGTTAT